MWVPLNSNQHVLSLVQVASSDASNIEASIKEEDGCYVINGHKWWTSGTWRGICFSNFSVCVDEEASGAHYVWHGRLRGGGVGLQRLLRT
jgi:hypothetical protein